MASFARKALRAATVRAGTLFRLLPTRLRFTLYYVTNYWGDAESRSGWGSTLEYTRQLREDLPRLLRRLQVKVLLDAPCGDFNWFRHVERDGFSYIGGDIVARLIEDNRRKYSVPGVSFVVLDITRDRLPSAELLMCRDCLFHLSNDDILRFLRNFRSSGIPWLLTTCHLGLARNDDIVTGDFRLLDLRLAPYNLPNPVESIPDSVPGAPPRILGLWSAKDVSTALEMLESHGSL